MNRPRNRLFNQCSIVFFFVCLAIAFVSQIGVMVADDEEITCYNCTPPPPPQSCPAVTFGREGCDLTYPGPTCELTGDVCKKADR